MSVLVLSRGRRVRWIQAAGLYVAAVVLVGLAVPWIAVSALVCAIRGRTWPRGPRPKL